MKINKPPVEGRVGIEIKAPKGFSIEGYFADKMERPNENLEMSEDKKAEKIINKLKDIFASESGS